MLSIILTLLIVSVFGRLAFFGIRATWKIGKAIICLVLLPIVLIAFVIAGLLYLALPILIIAGIISLVLPKLKSC